jgi:hypothetical protein
VSALTIRHGGAMLPLDVLLSMIPGLPRAALSRLTERAIDRMDELDGDCDLEDDDPDACAASDDDIRGGFSLSTQQYATALIYRPGDDADAEIEDLRH